MLGAQLPGSPRKTGPGINAGFTALAVLISAAAVVFLRQHDAAVVVPPILALYAGLGWTYYCVRRVLAGVRNISAEMAQAAREVSGAAAQLSASGQTLAQGVTAQAESVSETSGTSDLMASITRQNADSGRSAMEVMSQSEQLAGQASGGLKSMADSIRDINASATRISQVTRIVDEIAFQTNILALNAAVEAARAGAAGAGFAVVADEVRNLAQRCAQAAKDIVGLVEESLVRTQEGMAKFEHVSGAMHALIENTARVKEFVDQTTMIGGELAQGTEQISRNMRSLEELTQKTAAISEEAAATSEQMSAQAESMSGLVSHLHALSGAGQSDVRQGRTPWQRN